ncbi:MAG: hypothetical protein M3Y59_04240 [Myxococcota bacterium]|nr:hypothetical protein [Myxococcota bacterium]
MAKQISQAWDLAKAQLQQLRQQVEKTAELATVKSRKDALDREREKALRNFGEAVWREVQRGALKLPASLVPAQRTMQEIDRKLDKQSAEISDLLAEGAEAADRLAAKKKGPGPKGR